MNVRDWGHGIVGLVLYAIGAMIALGLLLAVVRLAAWGFGL